MNPQRWLMRMQRWARRPPPAGRVLLVLAVILLCIGVALLERAFGWPDWLTVNPPPRPPRA